MRKWQDLAPLDDAGSWNDCAAVQPTPYGTYETCSSLAPPGSATGSGTPIYAFKAQGVSRVAQYLVTTTNIYSSPNTTLTDRTNGVAVGTYPFMVQYGDVTICAMGNANPTVFSTGANFSALAGAPKAEFFVVQSNCVVAFNTDSAVDGWAASDVGDYTNWTTGEAASGRIITTPGVITAAVPFGNDIIVFKPSAIYRMTYVGGLVKWQIQMLWRGVGCTVAAGQTQNYSKYYARQGIKDIMFFGQGNSPLFTTRGTNVTSWAYLFDGTSPPRCVNLLTSVFEGVVLHDPSRDTYTVCPIIASANRAYFYNSRMDAWGQTGASFVPSGSANAVPEVGDYYIRQTKSPMPNWWGKGAGGIVLIVTDANTSNLSVTPFMETMKIGREDQMTNFSRLTPNFIRKAKSITDLTYPSCTVSTFVERSDTTPQNTITIALSATSPRERFDFTTTANFARFKVSWDKYDAEVDDYEVTSSPAGTN